MSDDPQNQQYQPHPDDTEHNHLVSAMPALARARPTNRFYIFPMNDRTEIAFGNARHASLSGHPGTEKDGQYIVDYHSSVSMDEAMLREFHLRLSRLLEVMDEANA